MKSSFICKKCISGRKNTVGKKCQACIDNNLFEEKSKSVIQIKRNLNWTLTDKKGKVIIWFELRNYSTLRIE